MTNTADRIAKAYEKYINNISRSNVEDFRKAIQDNLPPQISVEADMEGKIDKILEEYRTGKVHLRKILEKHLSSKE